MLICLSPHPDDAVLSCGGLLAMARERGQPAQVITILAGPAPPTAELTPFARQLHHAWGDLPDPMAHRRQEDSRALEVVGAAGTWWDYLDAIYRHPAYDSEEHLFGAPAAETSLERRLLRRFLALPRDNLLLFPLAVGHHVDHQLIFRVGWRVWLARRRVAFYEDLPYTAWEGGPQVRLAGLDLPLYPEIVEVTPCWPTKVAAVSCYSSQFAALTHDGVPLLEALERYAAALLAGGYAERLWWPLEGLWI